MSHSRKSLTAGALHSFPVPDPKTDLIAKVCELRGSNTCEVELPSAEKMLVQIPTRFRKLIWIKRGNFVIIRTPQSWTALDRKIRAQVEHVLFPDQIKYLIQENEWPKVFGLAPEILKSIPDGEKLSLSKNSDDENEDNSLDEYFVNSNHKVLEDSEEEDTSDEED